MFITRGEFGLPNYHCKDFADLHEKFSNEEINKFIKETFTYVRLRFKQKDVYDSSISEEGLLYNELPYY